jgi:hypothetical protein
MSEPRRVPPHEAWDAVADMAIDEEARRLEGLSGEELDREVAAAGRDPAAERAKGAALAARLLAERAARGGQGAERAPAAGPARSRSTRPIWLLAAALALAVLLALEGGTIVAWMEGPPAPSIGPTPEREPPPTVVAARARAEAQDACQKGLWGLCASKLDEAKAIDPAGEALPDTRALRSAIEEHTHLPDRWDPKGTLPR